MKDERLELVEKIVGKVVVRSGIFLGAMAVTSMVLDKVEKHYLEKKQPS